MQPKLIKVQENVKKLFNDLNMRVKKHEKQMSNRASSDDVVAPLQVCTVLQSLKSWMIL